MVYLMAITNVFYYVQLLDTIYIERFWRTVKYEDIYPPVFYGYRTEERSEVVHQLL